MFRKWMTRELRKECYRQRFIKSFAKGNISLIVFGGCQKMYTLCLIFNQNLQAESMSDQSQVSSAGRIRDKHLHPQVVVYFFVYLAGSNQNRTWVLLK